MSTRPALRTLLVIIFAASARSYRMPDSSPVASGCRRSCSMMNRSIVTTDVGVCRPTLHLSSMGVSAGVAQAYGSVGAGVGLESVGMVAAAHTLPEVAHGESHAVLKLLNMPQFVQEQLGIEP